jgi:hypothetical protein
MYKKLRVLLILAVACCLVGPAFALAQEPATSSTPPAATSVPTTTPTPKEQAAAQRKAELREKHLAKKLRGKIHRQRGQANYWRGVRFKQPLHFHRKRLMGLSTIKLKPILKYAKNAHHRAHYKAKHPPMLWAWMCIHRHEGSWTDPNAPYWGGLQMDKAFMKKYNPKLYYSKGTADHWTPLEQVWTAVKAAFWKGRGFGPWPNTRIPCGV